MLSASCGGAIDGRLRRHYRLDMLGLRVLTSALGVLLERGAREEEGGDMADQPFGARPAIPRTRPKGASSIPGILFVAAMAAAFWLGTIWASNAWLG